VRVVAYVDESGTGKGVCNCIVIAAIVSTVPRGVSYLEHLSDVVEEIRRRAGVRGELKWRIIKRRGVGEWAYALVTSRADTRFVWGHIDAPETTNTLMRTLVAGLGKARVVADHGLPKLQGVEYHDSRRVPGIQLADIVAGRLAEEFCRQRRTQRNRT